MKVLSLFDGMACGMLAMQAAGIKVDRYVAFEIDKYAIQTSSHNFPMIEHRGDVFQADFTEFRGFDFLIGGSPCTKWSIAQKNGRETEASGIGWELFCQYVRALHEVKPMYFIYENNKSMHNNIRTAITEAFGFEPICINSALVSAQNRQRLYWVGKRNADGTYSKVHVDQPEDMGILLRDVLDGMTNRNKGRCVLSSIGRTTTREYFKKDQGTMVFEPIGESVDGKAYAIKANYFKSAEGFTGGTTAVAEPVACRCRGRTDKYGNGYAKYECREDQKANTLDTNTVNGSMVAEPVRVVCYPIYATPVEWKANGKPTKAISWADGKTYPVYEVRDGQITIKGKQYPIKLADGDYIIRKLTVSECKRLQTVPEWYEFPVSNSQAYKMLGNGWTVEVIAHLLNSTQKGDVNVL